MHRRTCPTCFGKSRYVEPDIVELAFIAFGLLKPRRPRRKCATCGSRGYITVGRGWGR